MTNESKPNPQSPGAHDHESAPDQPSVSPRKALFGIVVVLLVFAALAVFGMLSRRHNDEVLADTTTGSLRPPSSRCRPRPARRSTALSFPAT